MVRMVHRRSIRFLREGRTFSICCNVAYFEPARLTIYILSLAFSVLYRVQIGCNVARGRVFASRQYHLFYGPSTMVLDRTAFQDEWQQGCFEGWFEVLCVLKGVVLDRGMAITGFRAYSFPHGSLNI